MSTTMIEPYDAQMLDFSSDPDVHMHTSVSSPKLWPQTEATMDDDIPTQQHEDVEVEMEPYHSDPIEYEMVDDDGVVAANTELVDVEFVDAPQDSDAVIAQPTDIPSYEPAPIPFEHGQADDHPHIMTELVSVVHDTAEPHPEAEAGSTAFFHKPTPMPHEPTPYDHRPADVIEAPHAHQESSDSAVPHTENVMNDVAVVSVTDESYHSPSQQGAILPETLDSNDAQLESAAAVEQSEEDSTSYDQATSAPEIPENHETVTTDLAPADEPYLAEVLADVPEEHVQREAEFETHVAHDVSEATEGAESDPHEISEGVFIEPPPAVLLELPSSDQPECCLFNVLDQAQGESTESERLPSEVLLSHRPTLYYERLSDVFDALRQEEKIQRLPEFLESEMVLDAYDLQLAVSEDNIYAREVTLHDLNLLHDGSDLTGPLRCRLRFVKPRFIERYHQLKDQIARLNVAEEGGELYAEETVQREDEAHDAYYEEEQPETVYEEEEGDISVARNEDVQAVHVEGETQYEDGDIQYPEYEEVIDGEVPPDEEHGHEGIEAVREKAPDVTQGGVGDEVYEAPEVTEEDIGPLEYEGEAGVVPEEDYAPSQHEEEAYEETQDEYLGSGESGEVIDQTSLSHEQSGIEPTDDAVAAERDFGEDDALYEDDSHTVSSNLSEPVAVNPEDDRVEAEDVTHPLTDDTEDKSSFPIAGPSHQPEHISERHENVNGSSYEMKPESETEDYQKPEDELWDETFDEDDEDDLALAEQPEDASTESATLSSKPSNKRAHDEADLQDDKLESDAQSDRLSQAASPEKRSRTR